MKRIPIFILILSLVFTLTACQTSNEYKRQIFDFVNQNYNVILEACEVADEDTLLGIEEILEVDVTEGYVICYSGGEGIAPSSQYYGFYYSEENIPVAVDCNQYILCSADKLTPDGNGYEYIDEYKNVFYTEHIKGNIYFYSASY